MKKKNVRKMLAFLLVLVVAFMLWVLLFANLPAAGGTWLTFVNWHKNVLTEIDANKFFYAFLASLIFVGGHFATKGR